jgi:multidrug efflux pump subunit AcrA (membrane-fusion protein)
MVQLLANRPPETTSSDKSEALLSSLLACPELQASVHALLKGLMARAGANRAALSWYEHGHARLALQLQAQGDGRVGLDPAAAARAEELSAAMEESIDQGVTLVAGAASAPGVWVTLAHRQCLAGRPGSMITTPLPGADAPLGAITLQWAGLPPTTAPAELERLAVELAPWLAMQRQAQQPWHWHARRALLAQQQAWTQGDGRRKLWVAGAVGLLALAALPLPDHVGANARVEGAQQRVLVAPTDGFIKATHAHPGDQVKANQLLADLAEQDLKIERDKWQSQIAQQDNAYASAMTKADRAEAALSLSRLEEAQAQLALVDEQLVRSQLRAPFDGVLIQGDLSQSIGAPVKQGDALMTVASTQRYRVILDVEEQDIARIKIGQNGQIRLSALPWDAVSLRVQRITPLAQARDGRQIYEVQAEFTQAPPEGLRPGLMGHAKVQVAYRPVLWGWVSPLVDRVALAIWSWWG